MVIININVLIAKFENSKKDSKICRKKLEEKQAHLQALITRTTIRLIPAYTHKSFTNGGISAHFLHSNL